MNSVQASPHSSIFSLDSSPKVAFVDPLLEDSDETVLSVENKQVVVSYSDLLQTVGELSKTHPEAILSRLIEEKNISLLFLVCLRERANLSFEAKMNLCVKAMESSPLDSSYLSSLFSLSDLSEPERIRLLEEATANKAWVYVDHLLASAPCSFDFSQIGKFEVKALAHQNHEMVCTFARHHLESLPGDLTTNESLVLASHLEKARSHLLFGSLLEKTFGDRFNPSNAKSLHKELKEAIDENNFFRFRVLCENENFHKLSEAVRKELALFAISKDRVPTYCQLLLKDVNKTHDFVVSCCESGSFQNIFYLVNTAPVFKDPKSLSVALKDKLMERGSLEKCQTSLRDHFSAKNPSPCDYLMILLVDSEQREESAEFQIQADRQDFEWSSSRFSPIKA